MNSSAPFVFIKFVSVVQSTRLLALSSHRLVPGVPAMRRDPAMHFDALLAAAGIVRLGDDVLEGVEARGYRRGLGIVSGDARDVKRAPRRRIWTTTALKL